MSHGYQTTKKDVPKKLRRVRVKLCPSWPRCNCIVRGTKKDCR